MAIASPSPTATPASIEVPQGCPGGDHPDRFDVLEAWYPVAYVADLDPQKPYRFTLLDQDLVIWWDRTAQQWRSFRDECPHRLVPLSEGRINEQGRLECPYHGWAFSGTGQCEVIPQIPQVNVAQSGTESPVAAIASPRACVRSFPTAVVQELLFVYPGTIERAETVPVPRIEALEADPQGWVCLNTFRDLPYDAFTLLENVLDSSHIPFTHHKTVGKRENASAVDLELKSADRQGFVGFWEEGPRKGTLGSQHTYFVAPNFMYHDLTSQQFGRTLTVVYATPLRKGECRLFARFPFKFSSALPGRIMKLTPQWYSHRGQNRVLEDDQIFLHYQERSLAQAGGSEQFAKAFYLPTAADRFVQAFHQWQHQYCSSPLENIPLPPPQLEEDLLDRYHSHTKHCASCRGALQRFQQLQQVSIAIAIVSAASLPLIWGLAGTLPTLVSVFAGGGILVGSLVAWALQQFIKGFYQGPRTPPRNQS
ncbi:MAG: hypothetical protein RLZZ435_2587 [Cyanobacteriota bacterium]|jgi:phenylpropionate dioxygenase-like ring-hydroxylating dioxygenase large terminal subunit